MADEVEGCDVDKVKTEPDDLDSMAPSGQNFHTAPAFGGRNVTDTKLNINVYSQSRT